MRRVLCKICLCVCVHRTSFPLFRWIRYVHERGKGLAFLVPSPPFWPEWGAHEKSTPSNRLEVGLPNAAGPVVNSHENVSSTKTSKRPGSIFAVARCRFLGTQGAREPPTFRVRRHTCVGTVAILGRNRFSNSNGGTVSNRAKRVEKVVPKQDHARKLLHKT